MAEEKHQQIIEWIFSLGIDQEKPDSTDLMDILHDGTILCKVLNALVPKSVTFVASDIPFKQINNISNYLDACSKLGIPRSSLFDTVELYEKRNPGSVLKHLDYVKKFQTDIVNGVIKEKEERRTSIPVFERSPSLPSSTPSSTKNSPPSSPPSTPPSSRRGDALSTSLIKISERDTLLKEFKYNPELEKMASNWLKDVVGTHVVEPNFLQNLKTGVPLCELINKISPGLIPKIHKTKTKFQHIDNVSNYLAACKQLGMAQIDLFSTTDLIEEKDLSAVMGNIQALSKRLKQGLIKTDFAGPYMLDEDRTKTRSLFSVALTGQKLEVVTSDYVEPELTARQQEMLEWVGSHLRSASFSNPEIQMPTTYGELRTSVPLFHLMQILTQDSSVKFIKQPETLWHCIENSWVFFTYLTSQTYTSFPDCHARDIVNVDIDSLEKLLLYLRESFDRDYLFTRHVTELIAQEIEQMSEDDLDETSSIGSSTASPLVSPKLPRKPQDSSVTKHTPLRAEIKQTAATSPTETDLTDKPKTDQKKLPPLSIPSDSSLSSSKADDEPKSARHLLRERRKELKNKLHRTDSEEKEYQGLLKQHNERRSPRSDRHKDKKEKKQKTPRKEKKEKTPRKEKKEKTPRKEKKEKSESETSTKTSSSTPEIASQIPSSEDKENHERAAVTPTKSSHRDKKEKKEREGRKEKKEKKAEKEKRRHSSRSPHRSDSLGSSQSRSPSPSPRDRSQSDVGTSDSSPLQNRDRSQSESRGGAFKRLTPLASSPVGNRRKWAEKRNTLVQNVNSTTDLERYYRQREYLDKLFQKALENVSKETMNNQSKKSISRTKTTRRVGQGEFAQLVIKQAQNKVRAKIAAEILQTEESYVKSLQVIIDFLNKFKVLLTTEEIAALAGNVIELYNLHQKSLVAFQTAINRWTDESNLGNLIDQELNFLNKYEPYLFSYNTNFAVMHYLSITKPEFQQAYNSFLYNDLQLNSYLIMPVQRIPRYLLLLNDLLKYTHKDLDDFKTLPKVISKLQNELKTMNNKLDSSVVDSYHRLVQISTQTEDLPPKTTFCTLNRKLIKEGPVSIKANGDLKKKSTGFSLKKNKPYFFLFSDAVGYCELKPKSAKPYQYVAELKLSKVDSVNEQGDKELSFNFRKQKWVVSFATSQERNSWAEAFKPLVK